MKKTTRFSSVARLAEISAGVERIISWLESLTPEGDEHLAKETKELKDLSQRLIIAIRRGKVSVALEEFDLARDKATRLLFKLIDGYTAHPNEEKAKAAQKLSLITAKYPVVWSLNQEEQSGLMNSLIKDLEESDAEVSSLDGVKERFDEVKSAQEAFETAHKEALKTSKDEKESESASSLKKPILNLVNNDLLSYLDVMCSIDASKYEKLAQMIEGEIQNVNDKVVTRSKNEKKA